MPKLRKLRRKQKYQFHQDRKKVRKSHEKFRNKNIKIDSNTVMDQWDRSRAVKENLRHMGLAHDPNGVISLRSSLAAKLKGGSAEAEVGSKKTATNDVAEQLEEEARAAAEKLSAKKSTFRFDREQVRFITHLMESHGEDGYEAMARDPKNVWQETAKQIRKKVLKFRSVPEHYLPYLEARSSRPRQ